MKKLLSIFALVATLGLGLAANTYAEDAAPAAEAAAVVAPAADALHRQAAPASAAPAPTQHQTR
jgi:Amt family ammonium transporter